MAKKTNRERNERKKIMRRFEVRPGTRIETAGGYINIMDVNEAGLCRGKEYTVDENGEVETVEEARLTASDIARRLKEVNGLNYRVIVERRS